MSDEILNRIKTSVETTEVLNELDFFDSKELNELVDIAYRLYSSDRMSDAEVVVESNGVEIQREQLLVSATLNTALFTHFVNIAETNNDGAMWNFQVFLGAIIQSYIDILVYEESCQSEWWEDANEYGLTSYLQAENFYNSTCD